MFIFYCVILTLILCLYLYAHVLRVRIKSQHMLN